MEYYSKQDYLAHYGILGMKWGVRRYQNPDGSLTGAGKQHYGVGRSRGSSDYKAQTSSFTKEDYERAEKIAENEKVKKRAKILMTVGAIALGAGCAYGLYKLHSRYGDTVIKAGSDVFRVASNSEDRLHDVFYATTEKIDAFKYKHLFSNEIYSTSSGKMHGVSQKIFSPKNDVKIAGINSASKIYNELKKTNAEFSRATYFMTYQFFNEALYSKTKSPNLLKAYRTFYDALRDRGYGGLVDMTDSVGALSSVYDAVKPIVFFGQAANMVSSAPPVNIPNEFGLGDISSLALANADVNMAAVGGILAAYGGMSLVGSSAKNNSGDEKIDL